jgi:hypothetical protein
MADSTEVALDNHMFCVIIPSEYVIPPHVFIIATSGRWWRFLVGIGMRD